MLFGFLDYRYGWFAGVGAILAAALSMHKNHDIVLAILHFLCNWIYVLYYLISYGVR